MFNKATLSWVAILSVGLVLYVLAATLPDHASLKDYSSYSQMYSQVSNDRYTTLYSKATYHVQGDMVAAADRSCDGFLNEDFSCSEDLTDGVSSGIPGVVGRYDHSRPKEIK